MKQHRYHHGCGTLDAEKEKQLESLGVEWENKLPVQATAAEHFDVNFYLLLDFRERKGHVRVLTKHQDSATDNIGSWLGNQRSLHRHGALKLCREKWFEAAGVAWERRIWEGWI